MKKVFKKKYSSSSDKNDFFNKVYEVTKLILYGKVSTYGELAEADRSVGKVALALAIIHHLCISNNVPFKLLADLFDKMGEWLIIEFIPKNDPMVKKLLLHRKDIFEDYSVEIFEKEFLKYFSIIEYKKVSGTGRIIYLMKKN
ncbi:MAG: MGMT family protein [Ignavibacteriaceae bacterium]|nr:MGMT family protein [Ignavibacteriaceae bacterium]